MRWLVVVVLCVVVAVPALGMSLKSGRLPMDGNDVSRVISGLPVVDTIGDVPSSQIMESTSSLQAETQTASSGTTNSRFEKLRALERKNIAPRDPESYTKEDVAKMVSLLIKTFERSPCLITYVQSIRKFYPTLRILIADDSKKIASTADILLSDPNVFYFPLPFDTGVSAGRNFLLDHVQTPYFIVSDDDNVFTNETKLEYLLADLENSGAEIVGACNQEGDKSCIGDWDMFYKNRVMRSQPLYEAQFQTIQIREVTHSYGDAVVQRDGSQDSTSLYCKEADMVANFFIAKTAFVAQQVRWDPVFKVGEHEDFFFRAKLAKATTRFCTNVKVNHEHFTCLNSTGDHEHYKQFRNRVRTLVNHFFEAHPPISRLEMPWATVTWRCACNDEAFAEQNPHQCMNSTASTDCHAVWDTEHVTSALRPSAMQLAMETEQQHEEADNVPYPLSHETDDTERLTATQQNTGKTFLAAAEPEQEVQSNPLASQQQTQMEKSSEALMIKSLLG